jgi:hypothetical protein
VKVSGSIRLWIALAYRDAALDILMFLDICVCEVSISVLHLLQKVLLRNSSAISKGFIPDL